MIVSKHLLVSHMCISQIACFWMNPGIAPVFCKNWEYGLVCFSRHMLIFVKEIHSSSSLGVLIKTIALRALSLCILKSVLEVGDLISTFKLKNLLLKG